MIWIEKFLNKLYGQKLQGSFFVIAISVTFILIYLLNILYPVFSDDWIYSFVIKETPPRRIHTLADIVVSQYNHYLLWGGRIVVHFIDQILLMLGSIWHDFLNALVYMIYMFFIYKISNSKNQVNAFLFILISLLLWFLIPMFCGSVLWITGSSNYLWSTLIILLFVYPYYIYYRTGKTQNSKLKTVFMLFLGFIAGWTNEIRR